MGYTHGEQHGLSGHKLHAVWNTIKARCYRENCKEYKHYGGRNITMCNEWLNSFLSFYNFCIDNGWKEGLEIDRIDNNGNYEPSNCQFITQSENKAVGKLRKSTRNTSGCVGAKFNKSKNKWESQINVKYKRIYLGTFETLSEAVEARIQAEILYFKEQKTNFHYIK